MKNHHCARSCCRRGTHSCTRGAGRVGAGVELRDGRVHERGRVDLGGGVAVRGAAERGEGEGQRRGLGGFFGGAG